MTTDGINKSGKNNMETIYFQPEGQLKEQILNNR